MKKTNLLLIAGIFTFAACDNPSFFEGGTQSKALADAVTTSNSEESRNENPVADVPRQLIKTGNVSLRVDDVEKTKARIDTLCRRTGCYVSSEQREQFDTRVQYEQQIRIPSGNFDDVLRQILLLGEEVDNLAVDVQDVTEEYIDAEARLKNKRELEARYRELLKQAKTISDILAIESNLNQVRSDIESIEGRLNYLKNQVSFSTIQLRYYQHKDREDGFFAKVGPAISKGWSSLLKFLIGLLHIWPFILLAGLGIWGLRRMTRRSEKEKEKVM